MEVEGFQVTTRLRSRDLAKDPYAQFSAWLAAAKKGAGLANPDAMCLCTYGEDGWPEGRMVLLKGISQDGFVFYTNLRSDKGRAIARTPKAELVFYWDALGRQSRIQGTLSPVDDGEADAYFASRARSSQIGAWASEQSHHVGSREAMDHRFSEFEEKFKGGPVPRPPHWSGFRLSPRRFEFWQADPFRFHDRFRYSLENGVWILGRLFP